MHVLIYSYNYHPEPIGIAPLMTELAEGLVNRGHQVRVVTGMPNYPERRVYDEYQGKFYLTEKRNGVTIQRSYVRINNPNPGLIDRLILDGSFITTSFFQAIIRWRPDVIFATVPPLPISLPVGWCGFAYGSPIVLNVQDIVSEAAVRVELIKQDGLVIKAARGLENLAYKTAAKISVISDRFVDKLVEQGVSKSKIVCIPNWVDVNFIKPLDKQNAFRQTHQLQDKFVVLYSGNIALTQGLETVIKAAANLKHIPEIAFVIIGEESALGNLKQFCQAYDANNVLLLSFQPREKLPETLAAADVALVVQKKRVTAFNMPSKIPVLLASGRAIVASVPETGTAMKAVEESGGGVVVPPEDADALSSTIMELFKNPEKVEALGRQGRKYAEENYSLEAALNRYEALFSELLIANR
ncbi:MAG: glycosyltransferase family 4 protein [Okeania sp. SIO2H7]|nr:glycosyltransferase family 4 protein [Okeania sp. SIO2H7]